jgi:hypothetical protein
MEAVNLAREKNFDGTPAELYKEHRLDTDSIVAKVKLTF